MKNLYESWIRIINETMMNNPEFRLDENTFNDMTKEEAMEKLKEFKLLLSRDNNKDFIEDVWIEGKDYDWVIYFKETTDAFVPENRFDDMERENRDEQRRKLENALFDLFGFPKNEFSPTIVSAYDHTGNEMGRIGPDNLFEIAGDIQKIVPTRDVSKYLKNHYANITKALFEKAKKLLTPNLPKDKIRERKRFLKKQFEAIEKDYIKLTGQSSYDFNQFLKRIGGYTYNDIIDLDYYQSKNKLAKRIFGKED